MGNCYLDTYDKTLCVGCRACEQACPKGAIRMCEDTEGYIYPQIDENACVDCGICRKKCPVSNKPETSAYRKFYALQAKNTNELNNSSSGGAFITFAKKIINDGGVVYGCILDSDFKAKICSAHSVDELIPMQGSKYVSSDVGNTYAEVKGHLENGKKVMYVGTPCQIAGLKSFLGKEYEMLVTVDFLCHGVPSGKLFCENIRYLEKKYKGKISDYRFRDKSKKGWGLVSSFYVNRNGKIKKKYEIDKVNGYFYGFISGWIDRLSCYSCRFVGQERIADITIGDFWGITDKENIFDIMSGVSLCMVNTEKGEELLNSLKSKFKIVEKRIDDAMQGNGSLSSNVRKMPVPDQRVVIYKKLAEGKYPELAESLLRPEGYYKLKLTNDLLPGGIFKKMRDIKRRLGR